MEEFFEQIDALSLFKIYRKLKEDKTWLTKQIGGFQLWKISCEKISVEKKNLFEANFCWKIFIDIIYTFNIFERWDSQSNEKACWRRAKKSPNLDSRLWGMKKRENQWMRHKK